MKRKHDDAAMPSISSKDKHRLKYAIQQAARPVTDLTFVAKEREVPTDISKAITRLANLSEPATTQMRDDFLFTLRQRDVQIRKTPEFRRWHLSADTKTARIWSTTNGLLLSQLLREAGGDTAQLDEILGVGASLLHTCGELSACGESVEDLRQGCRAHNDELVAAYKHSSWRHEDPQVQAELHRLTVEDAEQGRVAWPRPYSEVEKDTTL